MRIAHFCDLHHGTKQALLNDLAKCEEFALSKLMNVNPDVICICGDLYHEGVYLGSDAASTAIDFVRRCGDIAPTICIRGTSSHDSAGQIEILNRVKAVYPIYATEKIEQVGYCQNDGFVRYTGNQVGFCCEKQQFVFSCVPSIGKAGLMAATALSIDESNRETAQLLRDVFQAFGVINSAAVENDIIPILLSHGTLTGALFSEQQMAVGKDLEFSASDLHLARASVALLGHIHKRQQIGEDIFYGGSLTRIDHSEVDPKGFYIHECDVPHIGWRHTFIETPARVMKTKRLDSLPTAETLADVQQGELVRLVFTINEEDLHKIDERELERVALEKGAADFKIEKNIVPKTRIRCEGISRIHTLSEKLAKWAETTGIAINGHVEDKLAVLQSVKEPEAIIQQLYPELQP